MQLNELLAQVDASKEEIDKLRPLKPEVELRIMQKFRLDWNYHSNAIEGNSLTLGETRAFLLEGLTASGKPIKDHFDIKGHDDLITFLELFIQKKERLTEAAIREMHKTLLKEPYETDAITPDGRNVKMKVRLGEYKTEPNCVRMSAGRIHQYVLPQDVPAQMASLVEWHQQQEVRADSHPVLHAAAFHHRFVSIHPFDDGNGRMARILMNLILMRAGFPPAIIKIQDREPYVAALRRADAGEIEGIVTFVGQNVLDAENLYLRGAKGESIEDADDVDKAVKLLKQELSATPRPVELSLEIQQEHFGTALFPLLKRLDAKLSQFDDMFAKTIASYTANAKPQGGGGYIPNNFQDSRIETLERLRELSNRQHIFRSIQASYQWNGFLKDGPNDFSVSMGFSIEYEERKMQFTFQDLNIRKQMVYRSWFSEDEIKKLVSDSTKLILSQIQQRLSRTLKR